MSYLMDFVIFKKLGCVINTICVSKYVNAFMEKIERTFIYPYIQPFEKFYHWFIGELLLLTKGSKRELLDFLLSLISVIQPPNSIITIFKTT